MAIPKSDEVDLLVFFRLLWSKKKLIIIFSIVFFAMAVIVLLISPKEYQSYATLLPEEGGAKKIGGIGRLAGLAGINLDVDSDQTISPLLYPNIIRSVDFQLDLLSSTLYFETIDKEVTVQDFFQNHYRGSVSSKVAKYTIGLPFLIKNSIFSNPSDELISSDSAGTKKLTIEEFEMIKSLRERIEVKINSETGLINISVEIPDATASAQLTEIVIQKLTENIKEYTLKRSNNQLKFIQTQYNDILKRYKNSQQRLALFNDKNKFISTEAAKLEKSILQNEYDISFQLLTDFSLKLEQAKLNIEEQKPIFTFIEVPRVPNVKSSPNTMLVLIGFVFFGMIVSSAIIIIRAYMGNSLLQ